MRKRVVIPAVSKALRIVGGTGAGTIVVRRINRVGIVPGHKGLFISRTLVCNILSGALGMIISLSFTTLHI